MKTKPEVVRPLPLSPAITEQSTRVLDAHDSLDVEQSILFGMYKGKKYVPSQLKGINSAGGMALVLKVLLPRFMEESGKERQDGNIPGFTGSNKVDVWVPYRLG